MIVAAPTIVTYTFLCSKNILADSICNDCSASFTVLTALNLNHCRSPFEGLRSNNGTQQQFQREALQSFPLPVILRTRRQKRGAVFSQIRTQLQMMDAALREHLWEVRAWMRDTAPLVCEWETPKGVKPDSGCQEKQV